MEMKNKRRTQKYITAMNNPYSNSNQFYSASVPYTPPLVVYPIQQSYSPYSARKMYPEMQNYYPPTYPSPYPYNPMLAYNQPWLYPPQMQGMPEQGLEDLGQGPPDVVGELQDDTGEPGPPQMIGVYEVITTEERPHWGASDHA